MGAVAAVGQGVRPGVAVGAEAGHPGLGAGWTGRSGCAGTLRSVHAPLDGPLRWRETGVSKQVCDTRRQSPERRMPHMAADWHYKRTRWLPGRGSHRRSPSCRSRSLFASRCFTILIAHSDRGLTPVRAHIGTPPRSRDAPPPMAACRRPAGGKGGREAQRGEGSAQIHLTLNS